MALNTTEAVISQNGTAGPPDVNIDNLYPAIIQCFGIILAGYIAGRANIVTSTHSKGIGTYVTKFCLPALLLKSMCDLDFTKVDWMFLSGILISKTTVFLIVAAITLIVKWPSSAGYAGLFAIFATQSNDFALGYPIVESLYKDTHPDYLNYIYLIAPISLCFLNPIGFVLLEIHQRKTGTKSSSSNFLLVLHVIRAVITNPIVFMTAIGVGANFLFDRQLPLVISKIMEVLGNAYSATALFYIGLTLVGKIQGQMGMGLIVPLLLIGAKTILLPMITWQVVGAIEDSWGVNSSRSDAMSMYGFLYGTFPTAPSVLLYASQYAVATEVIATSVVAGTFLSAPLMFVSAKMMTVVVISELDYRALLLNTSNDISIASLICCIWVFGVLFFSRRLRRIPHQFLVCFIVSQVLSNIGMISYTGTDTKTMWRHYMQFIVLMVGILGTRCWTAILSLVLFLLHFRSLCFVLRIRVWLFLIGFGLPVFATGLLFLLGKHHIHNEIDPSFHYGVDQSLISLVTLLIASIMNIVFLTLYQRHKRQKIVPKKENISESETKLRKSKSKSKSTENESINDQAGFTEVLVESYNGTGTRNEDTSSALLTAQNIEDIVPFPKETDSLISDSSSNTSNVDKIEEQPCLYGTCNTQQQRRCAALLRKYNANSSIQVDAELEVSQAASSAPTDSVPQYQTSRFIILLILLQLSMFIGLFLCTWRLFNRTTSGIYVEIEFLDGVFNFGQGFFVLATFGFETRLIIIPFIRRLRRCIYGVEVVQIPDKSELDDETRQLCQQFVNYHKDSCSRAIVKDMKFRSHRIYSSVFTGTDMCDWLIEVGLARDRGEAITYGRALALGQIIGHVTSEYHFHDMPYFYKFITEEEEDHSIS